MKSLLLLGTLAAFGAGVAHAQFVCEIPTSGCSNGMFNQERCECDCISPFCPDANGDCTIASDNCGGNPFRDCERGENCPWWVNPLKAESCTTGPEVPAGLWNIYNTKTVCCNTNFAYSDVCDADPPSDPPTKHPTIGKVEDDDFEVIPIKFDVGGLPDDVKVRDVKDEMMTVLKRILLRLADRIAGLKISNVEERAVLNRRLMKKMLRALEKGITLYYNVYVVRDDDKKFGPLIIQEIRDSYDEVMEQIQQFTDTKYFGGDLNVNWCTGGKFDNCVNEIFTEPTAPARAPSEQNPPLTYGNAGTQSTEGDGGGGLAGWAVALIVIFVLLGLCCALYGVWFVYYRDDYYHDKNKEIENNIYFDDNKSRASARSKSSRGRKSRQIVIAEPEVEEYDDGSFTIESHPTQKRIGRDPTMYIPGQEDKPDPDADVLMLTDGTSQTGRRYYAEEPPIKPKREPTQFIDGQGTDPTMYIEGSGRDPTYFAEEGPGPATIDGTGTVEEMHTDNVEGSPYTGVESSEPHLRGIDETTEGDLGESYDQFGFAVGRDPTYYSHEGAPGTPNPEEASFRTQEPSVSSKSGRGKKKSKRKGSKGGKSSSVGRPVSTQERSSSLRKSLQSEWGASMPEVGLGGKKHGDGKKNGEERQSRSFYG